MMETVLAKALYDNIADSADELTFRKGDVITILEKDIDGLYGWWLCSLHGRQGIAPGNRLTEINREPEPMKSPPNLEELDYAVPRPYVENGEDYDIPRSVFSPQDYDFPKADPTRFEFPPETRKDSVETVPVVEDRDNIYQEIYDVPFATPEKKKPETLQREKSNGLLKRLTSPKRTVPPQSPTKEAPLSSTKTEAPKTLAKPPRKINLEKGSAPKGTQAPPRPPKPLPPRVSKTESTSSQQEVYDVPVVKNAHSESSGEGKIPTNFHPTTQNDVFLDSQINSSQNTDNIYDIPPMESVGDDIYDVPPSAKTISNNTPEYGDIYDIPQKLPVRVRAGTGETSHESSKVHGVKNILDKNRLSDESSRTSSGSELGVANGSRGSSGQRGSSSSSGSGKVSSEDDDYVDYQEIYGFGRGKPVNVYDVPVQPVQVPGTGVTPSIKPKQTKVSILQRINMSAVKGIKLEPPAALQRLTKLEQAVDVTVTKLLSFVTSTWRDPTLLRPKIADIRHIAGKAKVVLRLLTEFGLSTLVNAQKLAKPELTGILSRSIEPLLETYYSLKLALQRLDNGDWRAPLERLDSSHDDLDLIMVYIKGVPEDSKKLATVIRTAATVLYKLPKEPLPLPVEQTEETPILSVRNDSLEESAKVTEEVAAKLEKFKPVAMEAESTSVDSTALMVGLIKECVDANIKPSDAPKFSPETVRRLCGINSQGSSSTNSTEFQRDTRKPDNGIENEGSGTPKLPPRRASSTKAPQPPTRRDSGERLHHVRQKSLERFVPEGEAKPREKVPPNPPPKPKLDRKPTMRKSYKQRMRDGSDADGGQSAVRFRQHKLPGMESPKEGKRKCNSDPTELERSADGETNNNNNNNNNVKDNRGSENLDTRVPGNDIGTMSVASSHCSDSSLPSTSNGQRLVQPLSPRVREFQQHLRATADPKIQRSKSFSRTKPPPPKVSFGENGMSDFILSFNDKELLEFYKYEIDAQLFVLNEAMKALFASIEDNRPPKIFVSNSKFVVLSAHKFIYIGETLQSKISHDKLGNDITSVTVKLSECAKKLVHCTKMAALQYSAITPMREMASAAAAVSDAAIELHKVVKIKAGK